MVRRHSTISIVIQMTLIRLVLPSSAVCGLRPAGNGRPLPPDDYPWWGLGSSQAPPPRAGRLAVGTSLPGQGGPHDCFSPFTDCFLSYIHNQMNITILLQVVTLYHRTRTIIYLIHYFQKLYKRKKHPLHIRHCLFKFMDASIFHAINGWHMFHPLLSPPLLAHRNTRVPPPFDIYLLFSIHQYLQYKNRYIYVYIYIDIYVCAYVYVYVYSPHFLLTYALR